MKRGTKVIIFLGILMLVIIPIISAGVFSDFWAKITGKAADYGETALNITIGNTAPTITWVEVIPAQTPSESSINSTTFNFTANDTDGASNINVSSAQARFQRAGETTRLNTSCVNWSSSGGDVNFTCTVDMWYYDEIGAWTINVTIKDNAAANGENSSTTFTYNPLTAMVMSPTSLNWTEFGVSDTNQGANNDPIVINNTGNDVSLNINVTGYNLQGEETITQYIYAANISVKNVTEGCPGGTAMSNATSLNVTTAILERGNNTLNNNNATSGQEQIYFCVTAVNPDLNPQSYSSAAYSSWNVAIIT